MKLKLYWNVFLFTLLSCVSTAVLASKQVGFEVNDIKLEVNSTCSDEVLTKLNTILEKQGGSIQYVFCDITNDNFKKIAWEKLSKLSSLRLLGSNTNFDAKELNKILTKCKTITSLALNKLAFQNLKELEVKNLISLTHLNLSDTTIDQENLKNILANCPNLVFLNLKKCGSLGNLQKKYTSPKEIEELRKQLDNSKNQSSTIQVYKDFVVSHWQWIVGVSASVILGVVLYKYRNCFTNSVTRMANRCFSFLFERHNRIPRQKINFTPIGLVLN